MKYQFILAITLMVCVSISLGSNLKRNQRNVVIDRSTTGVELNHVVRKNPTITAVHQYGLPSGSAGSSTLSFGNNNDDNGPGLFGGYGKNAAIASIFWINIDPSIYFHAKGGISVIKETPAHVGYRHETDYITSVNKSTGKVEQHVLNRKTPITGTIREV